jgi:hypothetical protein
LFVCVSLFNVSVAQKCLVSVSSCRMPRVRRAMAARNSQHLSCMSTIELEDSLGPPGQLQRRTRRLRPRFLLRSDGKQCTFVLKRGELASRCHSSMASLLPIRKCACPHKTTRRHNFLLLMDSAGRRHLPPHW